jgi:hypothetical protein
MKLEHFNKNYINHINIDDDLVQSILIENILECPYSTFPYMFGKNSKESQELYGCGNCVAMSINLQKLLKKHKIKSYLIPATIPEMYYSPDFLDVSHVAVVILINDHELMIIDPAFYFLEPMKINIHNNETKGIRWKNVYKGDNENISYKLTTLAEGKTFNEYQTIPKNTYAVETFRETTPHDNWHYYLIEILNPDNAISSFNLTSKKYPFMASLDDNLDLNLFIKFLDTQNVRIKHRDNELYSGDYNQIPEDVIKIISPNMTKHFGESYSDFFKLPSNAATKIYKLRDNKRKCKTKKQKKSKTKKRHQKKLTFNRNLSYI